MADGFVITFQPIGIVHSPYTRAEGTPIQPRGADGVAGLVEVQPEYQQGLQDIEGFSHIILICHLHQSKSACMLVTPYLHDQLHGVFATRSSSRPNPIGLSTVRLVRVAGNILHIENVDLLDGTPVLDIKPYVPQFDTEENVRIGWLEQSIHALASTSDDGRFV